MASNLIFVCTESSIVDKNIADELARKNNWEIHTTKDFYTGMKYWQKAANANRAVILSDYPLEQHDDINVIETFYKEISKSDAQIYYAPRPNMHVAVTTPAIMGSLKPAKLGFRQVLFQQFIFPTFRTPVLNMLKLLPNREKSIALTMINAVRKYMTTIPKPKAQKLGNAEAAAPEGSTPRIITGWPGAWESWKTPSRILQRDLIERVGKFFPYPGHLHVIVLNKCNLKCVMCPYHSPRYKVAHTTDYFDSYKAMSPETFDVLSTYAAERGISLQFGQIEEVLMHKKAIEYIALAKKKGVPHIHLTTNGTLLTPDKADALAESGIDSVMFSVDAANAETYKEIRGSDLGDLEEKAQYFIKLAKQKGIRTTASFIMQSLAKKEREEFINKWRDYGIDALTFYVLTEHDPETGQFIREDGDLYDQGERYPCGSPWLQAVIFPQGEVSLCCKTMTDVGWRGVVDMGNINSKDVDSIWQGARYARVRRELLENQFEKFEVCKTCNIWSAHTSLIEHGDGWVRTFNETMETYEFSKAPAAH